MIRVDMAAVRFTATLAILVVVSKFAIAVRAEEAPRAAATAEPALPSIQYRRIYVPADKMDAWPRDGEKLIPIESRDFEAWIHSADATGSGPENHVAISAAEYSAQLETGGQLRGTGKWTVILRGDKSAFLPLGDMSLVLRNPHWQNSPQQPARIGMWGQNNHVPDRFGLEVARSGTLEFDWHIQTRSADDQVEIPWRVPAANSVKLTLDIPDGKQPRMEGGVVLESALHASTDKTLEKLQRRWVMALTPSHSTSLRIVSVDHKASEPTSRTAIREEVTYEIGSRGLEMNAIWKLDIPAGEKRELAVSVPAGLQLSDIKSNAAELTWHLTRGDSSPSDTALIDLPKSDNSQALQITLSAWQPLVLGGPWALPRLRPEGVFWSSGKFELSVAGTHELKHLNLTDCIETGVGQLNRSEAAPEIHSFDAYSSSAAVEINLSERQPDTVLRAGSSLSLVGPNLNGRLVTQVNVSRGATHELIGDVAQGWIVEALETIPADAMTQWFIDRTGDKQKIVVQLSHAASATRSLTAIVTARLQRFNSAERLSADTMRIVRWARAKTASHLLTFQSDQPYAAVPVGNLPEIAAEKIDVNDRPLLDSMEGNKVYGISEASTNAGLQFALRRGQFAARIEVEASYENDAHRQEYHVTATPTSGPIDRMLIYATCPLGNGARWLDKATNALVTADRLAANDPLRANLPSEGEVWLLRFSQSTTRPIELIATINTKRPERALLPLLFLPEATQQDARILVRSRNQSALWFEPIHLQTVPPPPNTSGSGDLNSLPPVCAAYRYEPANCRDPVLMPKLWDTAIAATKVIPLVARHLELESYVWPDGSGAHSATYQFENHAAAEIKIDVPANARLLSAALDGQSLDLSKSTGGNQPIPIRLPLQTRPSKLSLYFETSGPALTAGRELTPPSLLDQLPFVSGDWTIWLPEEYSATGAGLSAAGSKFNWRERLFGVLGRSTGSQPFNPFRLSDGAALVNGIADGNVSGSPIDISESEAEVQKTTKATTTVSNRGASMATPTAGWRNYHQSFFGSGPAPLVVLHSAATTSWTVALLLTCFLCGRWIWRVQPTAFTVSVAGAAALGLLLPSAHANLASGAVVGLLLSLVADWPHRSIAAGPSGSRWRAKSAITIALIVIFSISFIRFGHASPPPNNPAQAFSVRTIYKVLIPTDEHGRPTGTKYYVSDKFLRAIMAASTSQNVGQWLLNDAAFAGELSEKPGQVDVLAGNWTMCFGIETTARDTTIVLPLIRSEADWNATAMIDGVPAPLEWRDAGHTCAIQIPEPGRYSLSVFCTPKTRISGGLNEINLTVPPFRGGKIDVRYPEAALGIKVANAAFIRPVGGSEKTLHAELDRTEQLAVRWSRSDKLGSGASGFTLTEMRWLYVTPGKLEMNVKYVLEGGTRRPESIGLAYDDRWKLLTPEKSVNAKIEVAGVSGQHVIRIPIATQASDRQEISLRWRLVDAPIFGKLRLPPIELTSQLPGKRWLAISSDPTLSCEIADTSAAESTSDEFSAKWGDADANEPPQTILSNFNPGRMSTLSIRPRETEPIVDESSSLSVTLAKLRVSYEARITPGMPGGYRTVLSVPADLSIDEITASEDNRPIPLRWSRGAGKRVTAFFAQQITKPYRLVLDGTMPLDAKGSALLPHISTLATEDATQKIRLYRNDDVHVQVEGLPSTTDSASELPGPPPSQWSARSVATCYVESGSTSARIIVKPSTFKLSGDSLTSISRENGAWWANYRCQLVVEEGDLDILRVRMPTSCTGPFDVQSVPAVTSQFKPVDTQMGVFSVRFETSIPKGGSVDLRIRSPLKGLGGTAISVPAISIESLGNSHRYISLPDSMDSQAVAWSETGVRPALLPPKLRAAFVASASPKIFEIISEPFQVNSRPTATEALSPQIRLADTVIIADDLGAQRIATRLILAPHGLSDCILQLPSNQSLVAVELDGRPAVIRQIEQSRWQIALGPPQLAQRIEIVSRSPADSLNTDDAELQRPALLAGGKPISAEISLWSFAHPRTSVSSVDAGASEVAGVDQAALRFDRLVSIAESAKNTAAELPPPDGYNWFQPWAKLLTDVRVQTEQMTVPHPDATESLVSHTAQDQIKQAGSHLDQLLEQCKKTLVGAGSEMAPLTSPPIAGNDSLASIALPASATTESAYYVAEGGNDRLQVHLQPLGPSSSRIRVVGLLLISGLTVGAIWVMRRPNAVDSLRRWPHACGALLGIAYWAWMWPSWLGILIVVASVWLALRFNWPGRSLRTEASTVLRASRMS